MRHGGTLAVHVALSGRAGGPVAVSALADLSAFAGNAAVADLLARLHGEDGPADVDTSEFSAKPAAAAAVAANVGAPASKPVPGPPRAARPGHVAPSARPGAVPGPRTAQPAPPPRAPRVEPGEIVHKPAPPLPPTSYGPGEVPPPPVVPPAVNAEEDAGVVRVRSSGATHVRAAKHHKTGRASSEEAQAAAKPPANDELAQAKAGRAETMASARPQAFDEAAFVAAVDAALAKAAPHNLSEAGDLQERAGGMKDAIGQQVKAGKTAAAGDVAEKTKEPPDPSVAVPKPVSPMQPVELAQPGGVRASAAMPGPAPNEQLDLRHGPAQVDQEMADGGVTEQQLADANEPEFTDALDAKTAGEEHARQAPAQVRAAEEGILRQASTDVAATERAAVGGAGGVIAATAAHVTAAKRSTVSKDEAKRRAVADGINRIFDATKTDVEGILSGLDEKVDALFTHDEATIRQAFTDGWKARLDDYKDRRYSGWRGKLRWVRDKFKGLPDEANRLFELSRAAYERQMHGLVQRIGKLVSGELTRATQRIAKGRRDVAGYVTSLKGDLARYGREAAADIGDKFEELDASVKDKFDDVVDSVTKKYSESRGAVDDEIKEAQAANRGLIDKAIDAVKGVVRVIKQLKDLVLTVLRKVADVIGTIIAHPIRFLENFVGAVKSGISRFSDRILEHLKKGVMGWLFGELDVAGVEVPETFDLMGVLKLVLSVLGLTWANVRGRFVKRIGEKGMAALESGADIVKKLVVDGPIALAGMLLEKVSDFEDTVLGGIKDFIIEKVVRSGITFLISLLNPAAAFIKACKMIYDVVMFFVEKGRQIGEFVETVIDSVGDVARGAIGGVAEKIEDCLARLLPMAISFLASILGLGGIGEKIKSIIDRIQKPINKAIDGAIGAVVKTTAPIWKAAVRTRDRAKALYQAGKAKVIGLLTAKAGFTAAGRDHTVTLTDDGRGEPSLLVASTPMSPVAAARRTVAAAQVSLVDVNDVSQAAAHIIDRSRRLREMARQASLRAGRFRPEIAAALHDLAQIIAACWDRLGFDGEHVDRVSHPRGTAGQVGDVGRHEQGGQGRRTDPSRTGIAQEVAALESEHVVPWSWISEVFNKLYGVGALPSQKASRVYPRMTTVMTYKGAAAGKTRDARDNSDMEVLNFLRRIPAGEARITLRDHLPRMIEHRAQIIRNETSAYVAAVARDHGITLPDRPDEPTIARAVSAQLAEIFSAARELP